MQVYSSYASLWGRKAILLWKGGVTRRSEAVGHCVAHNCGKLSDLGHVVQQPACQVADDVHDGVQEVEAKGGAGVGCIAFDLCWFA